MSQNIFANPFVSQAPALQAGSVGDGTLTVDRLTHFTVSQEYTAVCTAIAPFTVFRIVGSLDGAVGVAVVGQQFYDQDLKVFLTINQGPTLFEIGDTFKFEVEQGIDLNRENIDLYDELPQKNFGEGIAGELSGNHNLRFNLAPLPASLDLQSLSFVAKVGEDDGNDYSIEYIAGSVLTPASLTIQDVTYTAVNAGTAGNDITIEYLENILGENSIATIQNIIYTALAEGTVGDSISIEYTSGGTAGSEGVTVVGNAITVQIQDGVSTADQIRAALLGSPAAVALIDASLTIGSTGNEPQNIVSQTFLSGGVDPVGEAGNEEVTVVGNAITVRLESTVSTAQQVADAVNASPAASALVTATPAVGNESNPQTSPVAATNLTGGLDDVGTPSNEIVTVNDKEIQVTFVDGLNTADDIKAAIEGNPAADALVAVTVNPDFLGTDPQNSPVAKTFLRGGRPASTYAFNTNELTDPTAFFEGNASLLVKDLITQGTLLVIEDAKFNKDVQIDQNINVDGNETVGGNSDIGGNQTVGGNSDITGSQTVGGDSDITGNQDIGGNLGVEGESTLNGRVELNDEVDPDVGPVITSTQKTINNLIQNGKILAKTSSGEVPQWLPPQLSLATDDIILRFLDSNITNTILNANFPQTLADGEVLYVVVDRTTSTNITLQKASSVPTGENIVVIALRSGTRILWNMNLFLDDIQSYDGILLIKQHESDLKRTEILSGEKLLPDATLLGATIDDLLLTFGGAEIDWANGTIYKADGTTPLGVDFTLPAISDGQFKWASITLVSTPPDADNTVDGQISVRFGDDENADPNVARKPVFDDGIPLGFVKLLGDSGTVIADIEQDDIIQMPLGSGGGGGGIGDITQVMEEVRALLRRLDYTWVTEWDGRIDLQSLEDTTTAGFADGYDFTAAGQEFVSTNLYGTRFLLGDRASKKVRVDTFQDPEALALDTDFTVEVSQDGGNNYYPVTMNQIGSSEHFWGEYSFPNIVPQTLYSYGDPQDSNDNNSFIRFADTSTESVAVPFVVDTKDSLDNLKFTLEKLGNPQGVITPYIVRDTTQSEPAELINAPYDSTLLDGFPSGTTFTEGFAGTFTINSGQLESAGAFGNHLSYRLPSPLALGQKGAVSFFAVIGATNSAVLFDLREQSSTANTMRFVYAPSVPYLQIQARDSSGAIMVNETFNYSLTNGIGYDFSVEWDFDDYGVRVYVNGILIHTYVQTGGGTRTDTVDAFAFGLFENSALQVGFTNLDNLVITEAPTTGFVPEIGIELTPENIIAQLDDIDLTALATGESNLTKQLNGLIINGGKYWIVFVASQTYFNSYVSGVDEMRIRADQTSPTFPYGQTASFNAGSWQDDPRAVLFEIQGITYNLKLRYTAGAADSRLIGFGVFYGEFAEQFEIGVQQVEYQTVNGDDDQTTFTINNFLVDKKALRIYDPSTGQVYRYSSDASTFQVNGQDVIFPAGTFNVPGQNFTLIFDQTIGGYNNSDELASLLGDNNLGSSNLSISRAKAGQGIKLMSPNGTLKHIWVDDDNSIIVEDA